jgi:NADPH2:quinone reductase
VKAIQVTTPGGPEALSYVDVPTPAPKTGEALVRINASGINFIDVYQRNGHYKMEMPLIPGNEAAGTVEALGPDTTGIEVGARVAYCSILGSYAEYAVVPVDRLVRVPDSVTLHDAASIMLQGMTAHYLAHDTFPLRAGDHALVHAGAGGVGLLLTQIAKKLGATVITTVSTPEKAALSREAGADHTILYGEEDFREAVRRIVPRGVDVVYDSVGKTTFDQSLGSIRTRGMLALFGASSGGVPPFELQRLAGAGSLFVTRPTLGDYIRQRSELEKRASDLFGWIADGALKLRIEHVYPLGDATRAHRELEARQTTGKLLLIPPNAE